jgi:hypothetical protein
MVKRMLPGEYIVKLIRFLLFVSNTMPKIPTRKILLAFLLTCTFQILIAGTAGSLEQLDFKSCVGEWVRPDGGYILDIKSVQPDGKIEAAYLNPRPIKISKAQANIRSGKIEFFIELRDRGYPGSYYTLTFDPKSSQLVGVYHHLGLNQNFDVYFIRK